MSKLFHLAAATALAAVAAASLIGIAAGASGARAESGQQVDCSKALCLMTIF